MILVTGGAGFIGSNFLRAFPGNVALVRMGKVGNLRRLQGADVRCIWHDLRSPIDDSVSREIGPVTDIVHFAAETHVDRSITDPLPFVESNVIGTANLLEYARRIGLSGRFVMFSTDEVFGPAPDGVFYSEDAAAHARNPYAAAKAGAEQLCLAWANTYGIRASIVRSMNVFGPMQHSEKFIPSTVRKVLDGDTVIVHASPGLERAGSRFYIHVKDVAQAVHAVLRDGETGKAYHAVGEKEVDNLGLASRIAAVLGRPLGYQMVDFHSSRPGHDLRYALADGNMAALGWRRLVPFEDSLRETVLWYERNRTWLEEGTG